MPPPAIARFRRADPARWHPARQLGDVILRQAKSSRPRQHGGLQVFTPGSPRLVQARHIDDRVPPTSIGKRHDDRPPPVDAQPHRLVAIERRQMLRQTMPKRAEEPASCGSNDVGGTAPGDDEPPVRELGHPRRSRARAPCAHLMSGHVRSVGEVQQPQISRSWRDARPTHDSRSIPMSRHNKKHAPHGIIHRVPSCMWKPMTGGLEPDRVLSC